MGFKPLNNIKVMKKLVIIAITVCCQILITSCDDKSDWTTFPVPPPDNSLAGSISFDGYGMTANASLDGDVLDNYQVRGSWLEISKVSDTEVDMFCFSRWGETILKVSIPAITVLGEPYDAIFDFLSDDTTVTHDDVEYTSVITSVTGWIKCVDPPLSYIMSTRNMPASLDYTCDININCDLDGKILNLSITSLVSHYPY